MQSKIGMLDIVALIENLPEQNLYRGQVGTVVELLGDRVFKVQFSDTEGTTYASLALEEHQLMVLHFQPSKLLDL